MPLQARNLPVKELIGRTDPYCVIRFGSILGDWTKRTLQREPFVCETAVIANNCNPIWPDRFWFDHKLALHEVIHDPTETAEGVPPGRQPLSLQVQCFHSRTSRDLLIGRFELPLSAIASGPVHIDHELKGKDGKPTGRLMFNLKMQQWKRWALELEVEIFLLKARVAHPSTRHPSRGGRVVRMSNEQNNGTPECPGSQKTVHCVRVR